MGLDVQRICRGRNQHAEDQPQNSAAKGCPALATGYWGEKKKRTVIRKEVLPLPVESVEQRNPRR